MSLDSLMAVLGNESSVFITGTDTDAGKTFVSERLLHALSTRGIACAGFKPISAGCEQTPVGLRNDDALRLTQASSIKLPYALVNPIAYEDPVAPHLAAQKTKQPISIDTLNKTYQQLISKNIDLLLVEGAGGWQLPLGKVIKEGVLTDKQYFMPDFVVSQKLPVILVVGMKLGCLNHALLSYQAIRASGCRCLGWIANQVDPEMDYYEENLDSLRSLIDVPMLAEFKYQAS
jgi:dethiobiotin synthetase